jgi:hypothetical protein
MAPAAPLTEPAMNPALNETGAIGGHADTTQVLLIGILDPSTSQTDASSCRQPDQPCSYLGEKLPNLFG